MKDLLILGLIRLALREPYTSLMECVRVTHDIIEMTVLYENQFLLFRHLPLGHFDSYSSEAFLVVDFFPIRLDFPIWY